MTPYNRLRQFPQVQQPQVDPQMTAPQGLQLNWMPGVGGEDEQQQSGGQGLTDVAGLLGDYLKKRRTQIQPGASPADAKAAFEAGGSL